MKLFTAAINIPSDWACLVLAKEIILTTNQRAAFGIHLSLQMALADCHQVGSISRLQNQSWFRQFHNRSETKGSERERDTELFFIPDRHRRSRCLTQAFHPAELNVDPGQLLRRRQS